MNKSVPQSCQNIAAKKDKLSVVNSVVKYVTAHTESLLNQAAFSWLTRRICMTNLILLLNLQREVFHPHTKFQIVWTLEMTGLHLQKWPNSGKCEHS